MHMHMHMHMPYQAHAHTHTHALPMQGVPGWPEIYGLGCCEYRLNATHAAPLVVDARQPLQTAPMWSRGMKTPGDQDAAALAAPQAAPSKPASYEGLLTTHVPAYAQYAGQGTAMSACLEATPHGQSSPWAAPQLGSRASSGRARRLWANRHSQEEARPLPRMLKLAASRASDSTPSSTMQATPPLSLEQCGLRKPRRARPLD